MSNINNKNNPIRGFVDWILRDNETGEVVRQGSGENVYIDYARRMSASAQVSSVYPYGRYVFIANDPHDVPKSGLNLLIAADATGIKINVGTGVWDLATFTRTMTVTFAPPAVITRTITHIGVVAQVDQDINAENGMIKHVFSALKLDPPVSQGPGQNFEVSYKFIIVPPRKSIKKHPSVGRDALRRFLWATTEGFNSAAGSLMPYTKGPVWFTDGGAFQTSRSSSWRSSGTLINGDVIGHANRKSVYSSLANSGNDNIGAIGSVGLSISANSNSPTYFTALSAGASSQGSWPLASSVGKLTRVYPHPVDRQYIFNETAIDKTGQGEMENAGPYVPKDAGLSNPAHWVYKVIITNSGGTTGAPGKYIMARKALFSYGYLPATGVGNHTPRATDLVHFSTETVHSALRMSDQRLGLNNGDPRPFYSLVFDGVDTFWGIGTHNGTGYGHTWSMMRWRAMGEEVYFDGNPNPWLNTEDGTNSQGDPKMDGTRFVFHDGTAISTVYTATRPYSIASDGAGLVFMPIRNTDALSASNPVLKIDNSRPGRWYQRPSGSVDDAAPTEFVVDAGDEIHGMFPFVAGDAGGDAAIRIVNSDTGADGVYPVATFIDPHTVTLTGANFTVAETGLTWHWTTVKKLLPDVGENRQVRYDQDNGRLWVLGSLGIKSSDDDGQTWSALLNTSTPSTPLIDAEALVDIRMGADFVTGAGGTTSGGSCLDPDGNLYWLSGTTPSQTYLNKFTFGTTGIGGDGSHSRLRLDSEFPGANKPPNLASLKWEKGIDNPNQLGCIWIHNNEISDTSFSWFRLTVNAGALVGGDIVEHNPNTISNIPVSYDHGNYFLTNPDGITYIREHSSNIPWILFDPSLSANVNLCYATMAANTPMTTGGIDQMGEQAFRPDGTFLFFNETSNAEGYFGSFITYYGWNHLTSEWVPWAGTEAQFDAYHGTTNGGRKTLHADWQELRDNVKVRFLEAGAPVAQVDEFKDGESFTFVASFGETKTNTEDLSLTVNAAYIPNEYGVEEENIKVATGNGPVVYWDATTTVPSFGAIGSSLDNAGKNWGWEPRRDVILDAQGHAPNSDSANSRHSWKAGIDLGSAQEVFKLRIGIKHTVGAGPRTHYDVSGPNYSQIRIGSSDDNITYTEVDTDIRWPDGAKRDAVFIEANGDLLDVGAFSAYVFEIDLAGAGVSQVNRTKRYWQILSLAQVIVANSGYSVGIMSFEALDVNGNPIGLTANHKIDEANDIDFAGTILDEVFWIQDRVGDAAKGGVDSGVEVAGTGYTDKLTITSGVFDTADIDITRDYVAWNEPGNPSATGYMRGVVVGEGEQFEKGNGSQAMARIIAVTTTEITIEDARIPLTLVNADWEVRRAALVNFLPSGGSTDVDAFGYCRYRGYFSQTPGNETDGRRFRVTRKGIVRLP